MCESFALTAWRYKIRSEARLDEKVEAHAMAASAEDDREGPWFAQAATYLYVISTSD